MARLSGKLPAQRLVESAQAELGGVVRGVTGIADVAERRSDMDDLGGRDALAR